MAQANIYKTEQQELEHLLDAAQGTGDGGATLLIPDLQRPFRWTPTQVTRLVDSLVRGWPFGTLVLWEQRAEAGASMPAREFWRFADRVDDTAGAAYTRADSPSNFRLVLDGQQRLQALLLAFGGDGGGFKLHDRNWADELRRDRPRARYWQRYASKAQLCLDLRLFEEHARGSDIQSIDYVEILDWVVCDLQHGMDGDRSTNYRHPLRMIRNGRGHSEFLPLARLWRMARVAHRRRQYEEPIASLLADYEVEPALRADLMTPLAEFVDLLGDVKNVGVSYLHLLPYERSPFGDVEDGENRYADAIVSIFTRINRGGTILTPQEITFAWIKNCWDTESAGDTAENSFATLLQKLSEAELVSTMDEFVQSVSFIWAALLNNGKLLKDRDLLRGDVVREMATELCRHWETVVESVEECGAHLQHLNLDRSRRMVDSLYALGILFAWHALGTHWRRNSPQLGVVAGDSFDKRRAATLRRYADRWLIVSSWAGLWRSGARRNMADRIGQTRAEWQELQTVTDPVRAMDRIEALMERWLGAIQGDAEKYISDLAAADRSRVRDYYLSLWVWQRLTPERWTKSQIALRTTTRKRPRLHIDHLVAHQLWEDLFGIDESGEGTEGPSGGVNDLGNMLMLEADFNVAKGKQPLAFFLDQIHDFQTGRESRPDWCAAMGIPRSFEKPAESTIGDLRKAVSARTASMKAELGKYIRGEVTLVTAELDDPA